MWREKEDRTKKKSLLSHGHQLGQFSLWIWLKDDKNPPSARTALNGNAHLFHSAKEQILSWYGLQVESAQTYENMVFSQQILETQNFIGCQPDAFICEKLPIWQETNQILNFCPVPVASILGGLSGVLYGNTTHLAPCSCCRSKCGVKSDWSVSMSIAILPYKIAGRVKQIKQWEVNICSFTEYTPSNT